MIRSFSIITTVILATLPFTLVTLTAQAAQAERFHLRSDYQLMVLDRDALPFQAQENLFEPSPQLQAIDKIFQDVRASTIRSFIPLAGRLFEGGSMGNADILRASMAVTRLLSRSVQIAMKKNESVDGSIFPLEHQLFLVPWNKSRSDLFYGANKITMQVPQAVELLSASTHQNRFQKDLAFAIKRKLGLLNRDTTDEVIFGGFRGRVRLDPNGSQGSFLEVQAIMGLRSREIPFVDANDMVRIKQITIPTPPNQEVLTDRGVPIPARPTTVAITIRQALPSSGGPLPDPTLDIVFGEFEGFDADTRIVMRTDYRNKSVPKFESDVNYKIFGKDLLSWIAVQFNFTELQLSLTHNPIKENPQFTDVDVLTSVGLNFKGKQYVWGKFAIEKVDQEFQKAFQANLDFYMAQARENLNQKLGPIQSAALKILGYAIPTGALK